MRIARILRGLVYNRTEASKRSLIYCMKAYYKPQVRPCLDLSLSGILLRQSRTHLIAFIFSWINLRGMFPAAENKKRTVLLAADEKPL